MINKEHADKFTATDVTWLEPTPGQPIARQKLSLVEERKLARERSAARIQAKKANKLPKM